MKLSDIFPSLRRRRRFTWYRCPGCRRLSGWLSSLHLDCERRCGLTAAR